MAAVLRCGACALQCRIPPGKTGACGVWKNDRGSIHCTLDGRVASICVDPMEKKPLFHFHPGSHVLSVGAVGCNFRCPGCQNGTLSRGASLADSAALQYLPPEDLVSLAKREKCSGIAWTYNEPLLWGDRALPCLRAAGNAGIKTVYVTNGYASADLMRKIGPLLDGWSVDLKAFNRQAHKKLTGIADFKPVLDRTREAHREYGIHVECITNITPTLNDDDLQLRDLARWIAHELGPDTPWHVTRFVPHLDLSHIPPTPLATLERAMDIGRSEGLHHVYIGNAPGHPAESTRCPGCGKRLIHRNGYAVRMEGLKDGKCANCGRSIPGRWQASVST